MEINKRGFSSDGYLDRQYELYDLPWGNYTVGAKGCGFMAAYNAIKASGGNPDAFSLYEWFIKTLFAKGRWGTNVFQLVACLIKHNAFKGFKLTKKGYADVNVGILLYKPGTSWHWATYYKDENSGGKFRFLNAGRNYSSRRYTIEKFINEESKSWFRYVIKVA